MYLNYSAMLEAAEKEMEEEERAAKEAFQKSLEQREKTQERVQEELAKSFQKIAEDMEMEKRRKEEEKKREILEAARARGEIGKDEEREAAEVAAYRNLLMGLFNN